MTNGYKSETNKGGATDYLLYEKLMIRNFKRKLDYHIRNSFLKY